MPASTAFISGHAPASSGPLSRYLPPLPQGIAAAWLAKTLPAGSGERPWVLDPFGASPQTVLEAARAGFRVIVAANNPVARFLMELSANPPSEAELRLALADLASSYKSEERIEPHLRSLYLTRCARCGQEVSAEAFLWEREAAAPFARIYRCPHCGDAGERPTTEEDAARAARFSAGGLHRARALERVAPLNDPDRDHAEEALSVYPPRAVYALFTLINKLDSFSSSRRANLAALLLAACDQANALWPYPSGRARPRQLTTPARYRENNVWLALEDALEQWTAESAVSTLPLTIWPEQPPQTGGICLYEGRLRDLAESLRSLPVGATLAALPRPNQAFWALSALWTGWLWGREAAAPFKSVLRRRRYDWAWHATALHAALRSLAPVLQAGVPFLGLAGEAEPNFLSAAVVAAGMAGFELSGIALREESGQAQLHWRRSAQLPRPDQSVHKLSPNSIWPSVRAYLCERGEPAPFISLHSSGLLTAASYLASKAEVDPDAVMAEVQVALTRVFSDKAKLQRYGGGEHSLETGRWWLRETVDTAECDAPLADRVEIAVVRLLQKQPGLDFAAMEEEMCSQFTGLMTPAVDLVRACLESYAEQEPEGSDRWRLRKADSPSTRRLDMEDIASLLADTGQRLGYTVEAGPPHIWREQDGQVRLAFYLVASGVIGKLITRPAYPPQHSLVVYPGSRAGLIAYKLEADPHLAQAAGEGWRFVKFRQVRRMAEDASLTRDSIDVQLALDPLAYKDAQIQML